MIPGLKPLFVMTPVPDHVPPEGFPPKLNKPSDLHLNKSFPAFTLGLGKTSTVSELLIEAGTPIQFKVVTNLLKTVV